MFLTMVFFSLFFPNLLTYIITKDILFTFLALFIELCF